MNQHFNDRGLRTYSGAVTVSLAASANRHQGIPYVVYGFRVLTDTVLHADCQFADGYDGDTAILGMTLLPGDHMIPFKLFKTASGTGYCYLK